MPSDKITINMGPAAYEDPRSFNVAGEKVYGEVFIHELVHAWQVSCSGVIGGWLCAERVGGKGKIACCLVVYRCVQVCLV